MQTTGNCFCVIDILNSVATLNLTLAYRFSFFYCVTLGTHGTLGSLNMSNKTSTTDEKRYKVSQKKIVYKTQDQGTKKPQSFPEQKNK